MDFEWMKDINLLAYVLGSSLGVTFILGVFLGSKRVDRKTIMYQFVHKHNRIFTNIFNGLMCVIFLTAVKFFIDGVWDNYKLWLGLSYWLSIVFIVCYVMTRKIIVSKDGVGYLDMFGRVGNKMMYSWKSVKSFEIKENSVEFTLQDSTKPLFLKTNHSSEEIEKANKAIKLAMKK